MNRGAPLHEAKFNSETVIEICFCAWSAVSDADGQERQAALLFGFSDDGVKVRKHFRNGDGIDLAAGVVAFFDQLFEVTAGNLGGKLVGDDLPRALFLFEPRGAGQSDPHGSAIHVKSHVDGIGVAGGDGHNVGLPRAVQVFAAPAIGHMEVFVHTPSVSSLLRRGKLGDHLWWTLFFPHC
jgi:hypothetical protein